MCYPTTTERKILKFNGVKVFGPPKCPVYVRLPWIGPVSQVYTEKIYSFKPCFNPFLAQNIFSLRRAFPSGHKDVLAAHQQSLVIYQYKC